MGELKKSALLISSFFISDETSAAGYPGSCLILGFHSDPATQFSPFWFSSLALSALGFTVASGKPSKGNGSAFPEGDKFCAPTNSGTRSLKGLLPDAAVSYTHLTLPTKLEV